MSSPFERLPKTPPPSRVPEPTQNGPLQPQPSPTPEFGAATQAGRARLPLSPTTPPPPDARIGFKLLPISGTDIPGPRLAATGPTDAEPPSTDVEVYGRNEPGEVVTGEVVGKPGVKDPTGYHHHRTANDLVTPEDLRADEAKEGVIRTIREDDKRTIEGTATETPPVEPQRDVAEEITQEAAGIVRRTLPTEPTNEPLEGTISETEPSQYHDREPLIETPPGSPLAGLGLRFISRDNRSDSHGYPSLIAVDNPDGFSGVRIQATPKRHVYSEITATAVASETQGVSGFMVDPRTRKAYQPPDTIIITTFEIREESTAVPALTALLRGYATEMTNKMTIPADSEGHVTMRDSTGYTIVNPNGVTRSEFEAEVIGHQQVGITQLVFDNEESSIQARHLPDIEPRSVTHAREALDLLGCEVISVQSVPVLDTHIPGIELRFQRKLDTQDPEDSSLPTRRALPEEPSNPRKIT